MADHPTEQVDRETLYERIESAIWKAMGQHEPLQNDSVCTCGVRNNMDGDVLFSHRYGAVADAVHAALDAATPPLLGELEATKALLAATQEQHSRTIADFCALRDALPRKQVDQILAAVGERDQP